MMSCDLSYGLYHLLTHSISFYPRDVFFGFISYFKDYQRQ